MLSVVQIPMCWYLIIICVSDNLAKKVKADKLKEKLAERRAKRAMEQKLSRIKKLGESSSDEDESATSWIEKNRKVAEEKAQAEKRVSFDLLCKLRQHW